MIFYLFFLIEFPKDKAEVFQVLVAVNYFEHLIVRVITVFFGYAWKQQQASSNIELSFIQKLFIKF